MKSNQKRQLAAILFADIVGYTSLMQKDETLASTLLKRFQNELTEKVSSHNGEIVNFYGDGALCIFQIPLDAVRDGCAERISERTMEEEEEAIQSTIKALKNCSAPFIGRYQYDHALRPLFDNLEFQELVRLKG